MPVSVIQIDVNDDAFKKFQANFDKYRANLKELPGQWQKTESVIESVGEGFAAMTAALMAHAEFLNDQNTELEKREKLEKKLAAQEGERARRSRKLVDDSKRIAANTASTTVSVLKWIGATGALAAVGGLFGFDALAHSVSNGYRSAQGLGVSTGAQQAARISLGRFIDSDATLGAIASAKNTPEGMANFARMGIGGAQSKEAAALLPEVLAKAAAYFGTIRNSPTAELQMGARGFLSMGLTMEDFRRMTAPGSDLSGGLAAYRRNTRILDVSDPDNKAWQAFSTTISLAETQIKNAFVVGLAPLAPNLSKLSEAIAGVITKFTGSNGFKEWVDKLGDGIQHLAEWLGSADFNDKMQRFVSGVSLLGEEVLAIAEKLRFLLPDGTTSANVYGAKGGGAAESAAMSFFMGKGWSKAQAAGLVANVNAESSGDPFASGDKGRAYGLLQWHADRQAIYKQLYGHSMQSVTDFQQAYREQLAFINSELHRNESRAGAALHLTKTPQDAGAIASAFYVRPKELIGNQYSRGEMAITIFNATGGSAAVTAKSMNNQ